MQRTHTSWTDVRPRKVVVSSGTAYFGPHRCRAEFEDAKLHKFRGSLKEQARQAPRAVSAWEVAYSEKSY